MVSTQNYQQKIRFATLLPGLSSLYNARDLVPGIHRASDLSSSDPGLLLLGYAVRVRQIIRADLKDNRKWYILFFGLLFWLYL